MTETMLHVPQSCYESQFLEPITSTTLRLSLPCSKTFAPNPLSQPMDLVNFKSSFSDLDSKTRYSEEISSKSDTGGGGWSFLQALSNVSHGSSKDLPEKETFYVHPQAKRSSLILGEKSLQLCTENLGNETGTDNVENSIDLLCSSSSSEISGSGSAGDSPTREQQTRTVAVRPVLGGKRTKNQNFPPPLTTMRGLESLHVRPHREEGRLVIEAVRVPPSASCFKAERSHGRLRLQLLKNESTSFDYEEDDYDEVDEKEELESEINEEEEEEQEEREGLRGYDSWPSRCREGEGENNEMFILERICVTSS